MKATISFYGDSDDGMPSVQTEIDLVRDKSLIDRYPELRKTARRNIRVLYQSLLGHGNFEIRFEDE